jgi:transposase
MITLTRGSDGVRRIITDDAWEQFEAALKPLLSKRGAPPKLAIREFLEAVFYIGRTGIPWRDLPVGFGKWDAVYNRFRRWEKAGVRESLWRALQSPGAATGLKLYVDSTVIRAHQHAAGGRVTGARELGRSRGGLGTKINVVAADERTALGVVLTPGQAHDAPAFDKAMCNLPDETAAEVVVADRAYDSNKIRADLKAAGLKAVIPSKRNRKEPLEYDREEYKRREKVERLINRTKRFRRVATRYDKLAIVFLAMAHISFIASMLF